MTRNESGDRCHDPANDAARLIDQDWSRWLQDDLETLTACEATATAPPSKSRLSPGGRRHVAVLFLDMKDFTALAELLDAEQVDAIIDKLFNLFRNQIVGRGGWVEKYEGDSILAAFGARDVYEDNEVRAIDAGLAMLSTVRDLMPHFASQRLTVGIRIGIHCGEVVLSKRAEFDVIVGDVVNTAARLQQHAPVGSILVSEAMRKLAGEQFAYVDHPAIHAKGKSQPLTVFIVADRLPRPPRWQRSPLAAKTRFVGREPELARLMELYRECRQEQPVEDAAVKPSRRLLVTIAGEAGMGKSRLVHEFLLRIGTTEDSCRAETGSLRARNVIRGFATACASRPYEMVINLLRNYLGLDLKAAAPKACLEAALAELADAGQDPSALQNALPILGFVLGLKYEDPRLQSPDPKVLKTQILLALRGLIEAAASHAHARDRQPLLLIFDDYHWSDELSQDTLRFLLSNIRTRLPLMTIILFRPPMRVPTPAERRVRFVDMTLESLAPEASSALINSMIGEFDIPPAVQIAIRERGAGNPYYIEELIRHLTETKALIEDAGRWRFTNEQAPVNAPVSLQGLLLARIERLDSRQRNLLKHASVLGPEFYEETLSWIEARLEGGIEPAAALDHLVLEAFMVELPTAERTAAESLDEPSTRRRAFGFKHALIREVAYGSLLRANRITLHRLCAEAIEHLRSSELSLFYSALGEHWFQAGENNKAIRNFQLAGEHARQNYDNKAALLALSRALDLSPASGPNTAKLHNERGLVYSVMGKSAESLHDFECCLAIAKETNDEMMESHALKASGNIYCRQQRFDEASRCYHAALEINRKLGWREGIASVIHNLGTLHHTLGRYQEALPLYEQALVMRRELGDRRGESESINNIGLIRKQQCEYDQALAALQAAQRLKHSIGDRRGEGSSLLNIGTIHYAQGRYQKALAYFRRSLEIAAEIEDPQCAANSTNNIGNIYIARGQLQQAWRAFEQALEMQRTIGAPSEICRALHNLGSVRYAQGLHEAALGLFKEALELRCGLHDQSGEAETLISMGLIRYEAGQYHDGENCFKTAQRIYVELQNRLGQTFALINFGKLAFGRGDLAQALDFYRKAMELQQAAGDRSRQAYIANNVADLHFCRGEYQQAANEYNQAHSWFKELGDRSGEAIACFNLGKIEMSAGAYQQADSLYRKSLALRRKIGNRRAEAIARDMIGQLHFLEGKFRPALRRQRQALALRIETGDRLGQSFSFHRLGDTHYCLGDRQEALRCCRQAVELREQFELEHMTMLSRAMTARILVELGDVAAGMRLSQQAIDWLESRPTWRENLAWAPEQLYFTHFLALQGSDVERALPWLRTAYQILVDRNQKLAAYGSSHSTFDEPMNRQIAERWRSVNG